MRHHAPALDAPPVPNAPAERSDGDTLKRLFPYLWQYKWRVMAALSFMVGAKVANVSVPVLLKHLIDDMSIKPGDVQAVLQGRIIHRIFERKLGKASRRLLNHTLKGIHR